jgi:hypothetical protein
MRAKPRWVCSAIKKWVEDKRNASVIGRINNQTPTLRPAYERNVHMIYEETFIRSEANSCSCMQLPTKLITRDNIKPLGSQRVGSKSKQPRVKRFGYFIMAFGTNNY